MSSADEAAEAMRRAGGRTVTQTCDIPVGRLAVAADPFGNVLVLLELSVRRYVIDCNGTVVGTSNPPES